MIDGYALTRDRLDSAAHAALFTENGIVKIFGQTLTGRKAIAEALQQRSHGPLVRHMTSTADFTITGPETASGVNYSLVFTAQPDESAPNIPLSSNNLLAIARYHDTYQIKNGTCLFTSRELFPDFFKIK